jgi:23S rRNA (cytosine1962-C5)-methyltransferase
MSLATRWLEASHTTSLVREGTNAFHIATGEGFWIEFYAGAALISTRQDALCDPIIHEVESWASLTSIELDCIYLRRLVTGPGARDIPELVSGNPSSSKRLVRELGLTYEIDFALGYNPGLFTDQRANRTILARLSPKRVLNTFAHTCAFSVVAASKGSETWSVDISKSSLARGRRNFELNSLEAASHRFVVEDVTTYLRRLSKRGEIFDSIILDPPTFGRGGGSKTFQFDRDFPNLLRDAQAVCSYGGSILLSTNSTTWSAAQLESLAKQILPPKTRYIRAMKQEDYPDGTPSATVWAHLP